jgi:glycosyltransferase involved in cell wall biosynthesis
MRTIVFGRMDLAFVSLPTNVPYVERGLASWMSPERIIHIVQNVRHANPAWLGGYPVRLLTQPLARIAINEIVMAEISPYLDKRAMTEVVPLGHDLSYFTNRRGDTISTPLRVAYTTWKSDLGMRLEERLPSGRFQWRSIREHVSWDQLRELYQWADVFLCTPGPEEGLYLPGLEAMAAGALVVTPDVGGNMAYCRPGKNCELVDFEDLDAYEAALHDIATWSTVRVSAIRRAGFETAAGFDLMEERRNFAAFLGRLWERIEEFENRTRQGFR